MTDTDKPGAASREHASCSDGQGRAGDWRGRITFAGVMMVHLGAFQVIEGLVVTYALSVHGLQMQT
jgi:uncharacterized membrane protein